MAARPSWRAGIASDAGGDQEGGDGRRRLRNVALGTVGTFVAVLVVGNLAMLGASTWARNQATGTDTADPAGVRNFEVVDEQLWRGAAPSATGYRSLAARGVRTIIDLRAEEDLRVDEASLRRMGVTWVHLPIRDGQAPSPDKVRRFLDVVTAGEQRGTVFVHCGAGVGRAGAMAAAYLVSRGEARPGQALQRNLAVGPPSLEQVAFVADLGGRKVARPPAALTAVSRVLDAPRRIWSRVS